MCEIEKEEEEVFKPIDGWEGQYEVSNKGRIKSLEYRGKVGKEGILNDRWTSSERNNGSYSAVRLMDKQNGRDEQHRVHRLVAKTFIDNPDDKAEVNHIDGNTRNNKASNLEWVTRSENQKHAIESGLAEKPPNPQEKNSGDKYTWKNKDSEELFFGTPMELKREKGGGMMDVGYLYKILKDKHPHHKSHKNWTVIETPPPGSDSAIDIGGKCPVLDNSHGNGYMGTDHYVIRPDCPLHGEE